MCRTYLKILFVSWFLLGISGFSASMDEVIQQIKTASTPLTTVASTSELKAIEHDLNVTIHPDLKKFYTEVGHYRFKVLELARANGGASSPLYRLISKAKSKIEPDWIAFCNEDGNYWCINAMNGRVKLFECPDFKEPELDTNSYSNLASWIKDTLLKYLGTQ